MVFGRAVGREGLLVGRCRIARIVVEGEVGEPSPSCAIRVSRYTLAITEAAATETERGPALTAVRTSHGDPM